MCECLCVCTCACVCMCMSVCMCVSAQHTPFIIYYFFFFFFFLVFQDRVSLYSPGCPGTHNSLGRPGWARTQKSACLCLPSAGIKGMRHHAQLIYYFLSLFFYFFIIFIIFLLFVFNVALTTLSHTSRLLTLTCFT
jgi:hypothetical protein